MILIQVLNEVFNESLSLPYDASLENISIPENQHPPKKLEIKMLRLIFTLLNAQGPIRQIANSFIESKT